MISRRAEGWITLFFLYGKDGRGKCFSTTSELSERNDGANAPVIDLDGMQE